MLTICLISDIIIGPESHASVAQSVVHLTRNEKVACSSQVTSSIKTAVFTTKTAVFLTFWGDLKGPQNGLAFIWRYFFEGFKFLKKWDEAGAGTIIKTVIVFPAKILPVQDRFQSLFRGGSGVKVNRILRHVGGREGGQPGAEAGTLAAQMQQRQQDAHRLCSYQDSTRDSTAVSAGG